MIQNNKIDINNTLVRIETIDEALFVINTLKDLGYFNVNSLNGKNGYYNKKDVFPFYGIIDNVIKYKHFNHKEIMESKLRLISLQVFKKMLNEEPIKGIKRKLEL